MAGEIETAEGRPMMWGVAIIPPGRHEAYPESRVRAHFDCAASFVGYSNRWVVLTAAGIPKGNDNRRDCRPHIFHSRTAAELDAAIFSGDRVVRYEDYLELRRRAIDAAVRRMPHFDRVAALYHADMSPEEEKAEGLKSQRACWACDRIFSGVRAEFAAIMAEMI